MLIEVKTYAPCSSIPSYADVVEALKICKQNHCKVKIIWEPSPYAGWYDIIVTEWDDPNNIYNRIPKVYGI